MARQNDGYDTDSGLVDEINGGVITDAVYETDVDYKNGEVPRLVLQIQTETDGEITAKYGTGPGWEIIDDGKAVNHPSKDNFNKNTDMGKLVSSIVECGGRETMSKRGRPQQAATFKGLVVDMERVEYTATLRDEVDPETGKPAVVKWDRLMFTGIQGGSGGSASPAAAKDADAMEAEVKGQVETIWNETKPDHEAFMERTFVEVPAVLLDPKLEQWVADSGNWS